MRKPLIFALAAGSLGTSPAIAATPSPPEAWAGCAGALVVKAERSADRSDAARYGSMARRALAQTKLVPNPRRLNDAQIKGVGSVAARNFRTQILRDRASFEKAAQFCIQMVAKLPH